MKATDCADNYEAGVDDERRRRTACGSDDSIMTYGVRLQLLVY